MSRSKQFEIANGDEDTDALVVQTGAAYENEKLLTVTREYVESVELVNDNEPDMEPLQFHVLLSVLTA